jgi:hypothetical protein
LQEEDLRTKSLRLSLLLCGAFIFLGLTGVYAAEEGDEDAILSDERTIPVAPGQVNSVAQGAAKFARKGHFEDFNARHNHRWRANLNKRDGKVRILYGNVSPRYAGDPEKVARGFLKDAHAVFGLKAQLSDLQTLRVAKTLKRHHVKLQQTYDGIPVKGALVLVHANQDGQVSMVQNDYVEALQVANQRSVSREAAVKIALNDLEAYLESGGYIGVEKAQEMVVPSGDEHLFIWEITIPTEKPYGLWVYHIDAESLAIIYKANEIASLKKGKGNVFKTNGAWQNENIKNSALRYMFTNADGYAEGWLWGLHADIYDANQNDPFAPNFKFNYDPGIPDEKPWFDATNAYHNLNYLWTWWHKKILKKYGPFAPEYFYTLSTPVIVNVNDLCNAFYTPELAEGTPGFVFGNEGSCSTSAEDIVLDKSVVSHEYTHAMMDWFGFDVQFGGQVDQYGRAMGEGNADWFAYLITKSPLSGDVAWDWAVKGYLRNLDNAMVYPDDVDHPATGLPEEHYTGQIWGGYLYDLSQVLKSKALKFVYQGLFYFTVEGGHRPSEPDFQDAILAQILAEQDLNDGQYKNAAKAWGCMASRGLNAVMRSPYMHAGDYFGTGAPGSDAIAYFTWSFPQVRGIKTTGRILKAYDTGEYPINVTEPGKKLTVVAKAQAANMDPALEVYTTGAEYVASGTTAEDKVILEIAEIPPGAYVIVLSANQGAYSIEIKVN